MSEDKIATVTETAAPARRAWYEPIDFKEAYDLAGWLATKASDTIPKAYRNRPGDMLVAFGVGAGLGMNPFESLQKLHVIHGKTVMDATEIRARAVSRAECEYFVPRDVSTKSATVAVRRVTWAEGREETVTVTIEDAERAKWGMRGGSSWDANSSWMKTPDDLLVARATSKAARRYFPEVFSSIYLEDEALEDEAEDGMMPITLTEGAVEVLSGDGAQEAGENLREEMERYNLPALRKIITERYNLDTDHLKSVKQVIDWTLLQIERRVRRDAEDGIEFTEPAASYAKRIREAESGDDLKAINQEWLDESLLVPVAEQEAVKAMFTDRMLAIDG